MSGWVQWSGGYIQTYGDVWTLSSSCGGAGYHYVELKFHVGTETYTWDSENSGEVAYPNQTTGYNSGVLDGTPFNVGYIVVYLCSTEGTGNCNVSQSF